MGAIDVTIEGIDLRDIRVGGVEVLRRIYPVFQDRNWTNRPWVILERSIESDDDGVRMTASGTGSFDATPLSWHVAACIEIDGLTYRFTAETTSSFLRNRLGLCVLHPPESAGSPCLADHTDGSQESGSFPVTISAQQPFTDLTGLAHEQSPGLWTTVLFSGETFEMEDHRNWTDASFKTYCTPINLPFPARVQPGEVIDQGVSVSFAVDGSATAAHATEAPAAMPRVLVTERSVPLPRIGLGLSAEYPDLTEDQAADLGQLGLNHLRVALDATAPDASAVLTRAAVAARRVGADLWVASTCSDPRELEVFSDLGAPITDALRRWYVFSSTHKVTPDDWCAVARRALGRLADGVLIGGGTDLYFTELNRDPPDPSCFDAVNFSLNPQVHAFDDRTVIQNAWAQGVVAANVTRLVDRTPVSVAPVTLRPRFNPNATDPASDVSNTPLPADVDGRQRSWFGACWTAMSLKYVSQPGTIESVTYFEPYGLRGIAASATPSPHPDHFPWEPGEHFPVWEVFSAVSRMSRLIVCEASHPEILDATIVESDRERLLLAANWSEVEHVLDLDGTDAPAIHCPATCLTVVPLPPA